MEHHPCSKLPGCLSRAPLKGFSLAGSSIPAQQQHLQQFCGLCFLFFSSFFVFLGAFFSPVIRFAHLLVPLSNHNIEYSASLVATG